MRSFLRRRPSRAARATFVVLLALVAVHVAAVGAYAAVALGQAPTWQRFVPVGSVEAEGDLFAYARILPRSDVATSVAYSAAGGALDVIAIHKEEDVPALLAGETREPLRAWDSPQPSGTLRFDGPGPCHDCAGDGHYVLVFARGDAWRGAAPDALAWDHVVFTSGQADARMTYGYGSSAPHAGYSLDWDGPVGVAFVQTPDAIVAMERVAVPVGLASLALAVAAAVAWALAERAAPPEASPDPVTPSGAGTTELLYLVQLGALYARGARRAYLLTAFAIVAGGLLVFLAGFPPVEDAVYRSFVMAEPYPSVVLFGVAPFGLAAVALVAWGVSYARVRGELRRWQATSARFEEEVRRLLGA